MAVERETFHQKNSHDENFLRRESTEQKINNVYSMLRSSDNSILEGVIYVL